MLLLFDVDGTLVRVGGAGRRALVRAFGAVVGVPNALDRVRLDGSTDMRIIDDAFTLNVGRPARGAEEIARIISAYLVYLEDELNHTADGVQVMPGASEITRAASAAGRCAIGLATGNVERGARLKLERAGLNAAFAFGGYGSDAASRADLVERAIERGQVHATRVLGRSFSRCETFIIGDTELDVQAARAVGAVSVGVLAGSTQREALEKSKPDLLVSSLQDPELWALLGLEQARCLLSPVSSPMTMGPRGQD